MDKEQKLRHVIQKMLKESINDIGGVRTVKPLKEVEEDFESLSRGTEMGEVGEEEYMDQQNIQGEENVEELIASILDNALNDIYDLGYELNSRELLDQFQKLLTLKTDE
jgi:ppGpp synthetase/RelA/SpoT-type nucleotidyltranferase